MAVLAIRSDMDVPENKKRANRPACDVRLFRVWTPERC